MLKSSIFIYLLWSADQNDCHFTAIFKILQKMINNV